MNTNDILNKLIAEIERRIESWDIRGKNSPVGQGKDTCESRVTELSYLLSFITSLQQEQDRMRYCIEYINPQYPLLDNGELNIRHLRIPDEDNAERTLTLMLSFGVKIYDLYRGNVKEGKLDEWPAPIIVDADDWYSTGWLHELLDCGCTL